MTEASTGLRKALARKAGVSQLSTEELLAQMTDQQKAGLAASLSLAAGEPSKKAGDKEDEDDIETEDDGTKKPKSKKKDDEYMDDKASAAKAATDRSLAVMASEHFAGREKLAATLLANDKLSAEEINGILAASAPTVSTGASAEDEESKARADMRSKLAAEQPGNLGGDDAPEAGAFTDWNDIHAEVAKDRGYAAN